MELDAAVDVLSNVHGLSDETSQAGEAWLAIQTALVNTQQIEQNWHGAEQELEEVKAELRRAYTALNEVNSSWVGTGWRMNLERFESWLMRHDATLRAAKHSE